MKSRNYIFCCITVCAALAFGVAWAIDPAAAQQLVSHPAGALGAMAAIGLVGDTGDMKSVLDAIEKSNKAFEDFKTINDKRLKLIEEGKGGEGDLKVSMEKAFKDMADQKALIESLEAKLKRPLLGGDGKVVDEDQEKHRGAFKGYMVRGSKYEESELMYAAGISMKSLATGAGPDGGFAVPKVIDGMIEQVAVNISPIRQIASVQQVSTQDFHKLVDVRGTSSGWVGETAARTSTNTPQFADINPPMGELYANPQATQVMLDDVFFNAEAWLADSVGTEFARAEGAAFVSGTGISQPKGFTQYTTAATGDATRAFGTIEHVATGASGAFKTLTSTVNPADDLFTVVSKLKRAYRTGSSWVLNKTTLFAIMGFKDYQGRYVFTPASAPGVEDTILGYPVVEAEDMASYTTASSLAVAFGNFKRGYLIVDRVGTRVIRDPFSNKPYIGFYTTKRLGGALLNSEAIKFIKFV
jgi:HK97 family phage major capsid protein